MNKSFRNLFIILIVIATALAGTSSYFYLKTISLQKKLNETGSDKKVSDSTATTTKDTTASTTTNTSTVTTPAPLNNRPSSPTDTVKVEQGQTLMTVGTNVGVNWTVLAEVNGIDADKINAGETIIVPKNNQVAYTVNAEKAASLQKESDSGKNPFRLSSVETAKSDSPTVYGIAVTDAFTQSKIDLTLGTAEVAVIHNNKNYTIILTQPVTKGEKGIWAITSIKPTA